MYSVLVIGSGGREHVFAWSLYNDEQIDKIFCMPGNGGTESIATNIEIDSMSPSAVLDFVKHNNIDLTIVGPEAPLSIGIVDHFVENGHLIFGPTKYAAQLETSKSFARDLMEDCKIPQPAYFTCSNIDGVISVKSQIGFPLVLKADGLASGKGVIICRDQIEFEDALDLIFDDNKFGSASDKVLVEEFLYGEELSVFAVCDGLNYKIIGTAQDHKRVSDGDKGPNTGGMGAYSPTKIESKELILDIEEKIIVPILNEMDQRNHPYTGFLYVGLMIVNNKPYVIEFNARMGDPETQVVIPKIESSFFSMIWDSVNGNLNHHNIDINKESVVTVVLASEGYPDEYKIGKKITGLEELNDEFVFHAGTRKDGNDFYTIGGRVINVLGKGDCIEEAIDRAYTNLEKIDFDGKYYRKDIGFRAIEKKEANEN